MAISVRMMPIPARFKVALAARLWRAEVGIGTERATQRVQCSPMLPARIDWCGEFRRGLSPANPSAAMARAVVCGGSRSQVDLDRL